MANNINFIINNKTNDQNFIINNFIKLFIIIINNNLNKESSKRQILKIAPELNDLIIYCCSIGYDGSMYELNV